MKLQIAMDMTSPELFWDVLEKVHDVVDIVELGNIGMYCGALMIPEVKAKYPGKAICWDQKVSSLYTNRPAIDLGADYVSVSNDASDKSFIEHMEYARPMNCKIVADMVTMDAGSATFIRLEKLGVDQITFYPNAHRDRYPVGDVYTLEIAKKLVEKTEISTYGGFTPANMIPVLELKPDVVVVGAYIWDAEDPRAAALEIRALMDKYS